MYEKKVQVELLRRDTTEGIRVVDIGGTRYLVVRETVWRTRHPHLSYKDKDIYFLFTLYIWKILVLT